MSRRTNPPAAPIPVDRPRIVAAQALSVRLSALNEVAAAMQRTLSVDDLLRALVRQSRWLLDFQHCAVALRAGEGYRQIVLHGEQPAVARNQPAGALGRAMREKRPVMAAGAAEGDPTQMQSALALPLLAGPALIGGLAFYHAQASHYTTDDLRIAGALATHLALLLHNAELFAATARARDELHTVLESIDDAVLVLDRHGRVTLANRAFGALVRAPADTLAGRRALGLIRGVGVADPLVPRAELRAAIRTWRASPSGADGRVPLADGRWVEWASAELTGNQGGYVITLRDISERVNLERLREDMAHMLVHDLRTPLTSILMGLDFLQNADIAHAQADKDELISLTYGAAVQMLGQVNTILDVSKLEAGKFALALVPTPVHVIAEQAMRMVQSIAKQQRVTLALNVSPGMPYALADPSLMRRVLDNMLGNALKWSPTGGVVAIDLGYEGAAIEVQVRDAGPGVPEELRAAIFEKYGGSSRSERRPGTGLGLAFCKLVVEAHGGRIGVRAAAGGGSEFWFQLPLA